MNFSTHIPLQKARSPIDYHAKVLSIGSCFSENIHQKLQYAKFSSRCNPLGILFHSNAIETLLTHAVNKKVYTENEVFFHQERWHCFDAHSIASNPDKKKLLQYLNNAIQETHQAIKEATHLNITLGTAWVYRHIATDAIVANCHKVPQKHFVKELRTVTEISESLDAIIAMVRSINPTIQFLFTLSPVRHIKDGFVENARSKAHLLTAIHQVVNTTNVSYFPSYEILMDELRDYRFYASDMVHPNETAIAYIWERFLDTWISEKAKDTLQDVEKIQRGLAHKPFHQDSEAHQKFVKTLDGQLQKLQEQFPNITF